MVNSVNEIDILLQLLYVSCVFVYIYLYITERSNYQTKKIIKEGKEEEEEEIQNFYYTYENLNKKHFIKYNELCIKYNYLRLKYEKLCNKYKNK